MVRQNLIPILGILGISGILGFFAFLENSGKKEEYFDCVEYQDSIFILNYQISQLQIEVGSLLLVIEELDKTKK